MKHWLAACSIILAGVALGQTEENPGSLYALHQKSSLSNRTAHQVGDILTVLVNEASSSSFTATTTTSKADSSSVGPIQVPILGGLLPNMSTAANSSTNGAGSTSQAGNLTAVLTVVVTKVLPNGNLEIEGTRRIVINKDTQLVKLTGVVRADDVSASNTISSQQIANAEIHTEGKGQISDRQRQGILTKILSWLF